MLLVLATPGTLLESSAQIEGVLLNRVSGLGEQILVLQQGKHTFNAHLEEAKAASLDSVIEGSRLQLSGICAVQPDEQRTPTTFKVLLGSADDIVVLARPSWWTLEKVLWVLVCMALAIFGIAGWLVVLKRRVAKQTEEIKERLESEAAFEHRYGELVENANDIIYTVDLEGKLLSINRAGERVIGYSRDEFVGRNIAEILAPGKADRFRQTIESEAAGQATASYDLEIMTRDGRRLALEVSSWLIRDRGRPSCIQAIARDVTERKQGDEALRESEERYRDLVEHSHEFIATHDLEGRILSVNSWTGRVLGYDMDSLLQMNLRDLLVPEFRSDFDNYIASVAANGFARGMMQVQTSSGERRLWEYHNTLRTEGVAAPIVRGMAHDVTERLRAEEALRRSEE
jgi:PAS domain S-box-containing protein